MTDAHNTGAHRETEQEQMQADVRRAVEEGGNIRVEVERITRTVFTEGRLDTERLERIIEAVGRGASAGAGVHGERAQSALAQALAGLDAAMARHAQGAKLSVQEALGRLEEFSHNDVKRALERLRGLESLMLDTLSDVARAGGVAGAETLGVLVEHARRGGTALGAEAETALRALASGLPQALRDTALAGLGAARETGARLAETASGFLAGVGESLRGEEGAPSRKESAKRPHEGTMESTDPS